MRGTIRCIQTACVAWGFVLVGLVAGCKDPAAPPQGIPMEAPEIRAIVAGELDGDQYPEVGALVLTSDRTFACSGVLISPTVFLTAGHCVFFWVELPGLTHGDYGVTFDSPITATSPVVLATAAYKHPEWEFVDPPTPEFTINHDVGVLVLDEPVRNIRPAKLPERNILDKLNSEGKLTDQRFDVVGYGCIELKYLDPPTDPPSLDPNCEGFGTRRAGNQGFLELMPNRDHLRLDGNPSSSALGDSGGPHYFAGTHIIASITSGGSGSTPADIIDETTRIDTPSALRFIRAFMLDGDDDDGRRRRLTSRDD